MKTKLQLVSKARWIIAVIFSVGVILMLFGELIKIKLQYEFVPQVLIHLGMALVISSIIGLFLELTEIKDFFERRLVGILSGDEFIKLVSEDKLVDYNVTTIRGIGSKRVTNPLYDYHDFATTIGYDILSNVGQVYRKDYYETVDYRILNEEETRELGLNRESLTKVPAKIVSSTRYQLISPSSEKEQEFLITCSYRASRIPGFEPKQQLGFEISIDGEDININPEKFITVNDKEISFDFEHNLKFTSSSWVSYKLTSLEYELGGSFPNYMDCLTQGATVHFSSREPLELNAEIFGMTANYTPPSITSNSVSIHNPSWVLPGHGYFITWEKAI